MHLRLPDFVASNDYENFVTSKILPKKTTGDSVTCGLIVFIVVGLDLTQLKLEIYN